jgi:hypothetical protein
LIDQSFLHVPLLCLNPAKSRSKSFFLFVFLGVTSMIAQVLTNPVLARVLSLQLSRRCSARIIAPATEAALTGSGDSIPFDEAPLFRDDDMFACVPTLRSMYYFILGAAEEDVGMLSCRAVSSDLC